MSGIFPFLPLADGHLCSEDLFPVVTSVFSHGSYGSFPILNLLEAFANIMLMNIFPRDSLLLMEPRG